MKREYQKPYLAMESFQLNAAIAASCSSEGKQPIHYGENTCIMGDDPGESFIEYLGNACALDIVGTVGGDQNDTICYHGPFDPYEVFIKS